MAVRVSWWRRRRLLAAQLGFLACILTLVSRAGSVSGAPSPPPQESADPRSRQGSWSGLTGWPAIDHAVLLDTGQVLVWSGSLVRVWDPATGELAPAASAPTDISGAGHVTLSDGTPLVIGGRGLNGTGVPDINFFESGSRSWTSGPPMHTPRWHPTGTALPDGRVLVAGGDACATCEVPQPEIFDPRTSQWTVLQATDSSPLPRRPFLFVVPDGRVLVAGSSDAATSTTLLDRSTGASTTIDARLLDGGSAVSYLPGRIMKSGTAAANRLNGPASRTTFVLAMDDRAPSWQSAGPMTYARAFHNLTLLPDGSVVATGGETGPAGASPSRAVLAAEIWQPTTGRWSAAALMRAPRGAESAAVLLPDGRVLVAGSSGRSGEPAAEIFTPPYLFNGPRPTLTAVPGTLEYSNESSVSTPDADDIASVALVRTGSVTRGFNQDQRFVPLSFRHGSGEVTITAPIDANVAPPGRYLLFLLNRRGVPSVASVVTLQPTADVTAISSAARSDAAAGLESAAAAAVPPVAVDAVATGKQSSTLATSVVTNAFSTVAANELLLAFVSAGSTSFGSNTTVTSVTGAGLTWQLVLRTNVQRGTAEIWRALAAAPLTNVTVTAVTSRSTTSLLKVLTLTGVDVTGTNGSGAIGATKSANGVSGAPTASVVTTRDGSWVFGVGSDRDAAVARTLGPGQVMVDQFLATTSGDTYWVQSTTAPTPVSGTTVTINDTAPTTDHYNLSLVEILPPDSIPPTVTSVTPAAGAVNVTVTSPVTATFSEAMASATITSATVVLRAPGGAAVGASVSYNATNRTATLTPTAALQNSTTYSATVVSGTNGVKDVAGNALAADMTWSFTTAADVTPPTVTSVTPVNGAAGVSTTTTVTAIFSEAMASATITPSTVLLRGPGGAAVAANVAYTPATRTATLTPLAALQLATTYTARVVGGSSGVTDLAGNRLASDVVWSFTTIGDVTPPTVVAVTPPNGATGIAPTPGLTVTFSEPMNTGTVNPSTVILRAPGGATVPSTATYDPVRNLMALWPDSPLQGSAVHTVTVKSGTSGVKDAAGNPLATDFVWSFTTRETVAPQVTSVVPAAGASGVATTASVAVTFNEPMDATTVAGGVVLRGQDSVMQAAVTYDAVSRKATLAPSSQLKNGTTYTVVVLGGSLGPTDALGNHLATPFTSTFTTVSDTSAPSIAITSPTGGAVLSGTVVVAMDTSDDVAVNTVDILLDGTPIQSANARLAWDVQAPDVATASSYEYQVYKDGAAAGARLNGVVCTTGSSSVQVCSVDVAALTPMPHSLRLSAAGPDTQSLGSQSLVLTSVPFWFEWNTLTAPGPHALSAIVRDSTGNSATAAPISISVINDPTPPSVVGTSPANGAANVSPSSVVTATFNEAMLPGTINASTFSLRDPLGTSVPATVSYDPPTFSARLAPSSQLSPITTYSATVVGGTGGMINAGGNPLPANVTWTFTTAADTTPPQVSSTTPAAGATQVAPTTTVTAMFNEPMNATTITSATVVLRGPNGVAVGANVSYSTAARTATLTPSAPLANSTIYTAWILTGATDVAGNALASNVSWSFTTSGDTTPPLVTAVTPAANTTGVSIATTVTATFNEAMSAGSFTTTSVLLKDPANAPVAATVGYDSPSRTVTLTPSQPLAFSTTYTGVLTSGAGGVKDSAGNPLAADYTWSFTTASDTVPPLVTGTSPAPGATGVSIGTVVTATFNEAMMSTSISTTTLVLRDPSNALVPAIVGYTAGTRSGTLTPASALANATTYTATVVGGANGVKDAAGNALAADNVWTFTTAADTTPPTVTGGTPANGATGVTPTVAPTVIFSEPMASGSIGSAVVLRDPANVPVAATVGYSSPTRTATLTPASPLAFNTTYTLVVVGGTGGVTDLAGNALVADVVRTFTTAADTTPPTVTGVTPLAGAVAVTPATTITGVFNEPMMASTIGPGSVLLRDPLNTAVAAAVAYDPATRTATLTPTQPLAFFTTYTATIKSGASGVKDAAGNALATDYVWSFTTAADTTPPMVTGTTPLAGAVAVVPSSTVTATFDEAMSPTSITTTTVVLRDPSNAGVSAIVSYSGWTATLTPASALAYATTYTATVVGGANGVKDAAGNPLAADYVWTFTTAADTTPPTVTGGTPVNGATGVSPMAAPTVLFSEPMATGSIGPAVMLRDPANATVAATVGYSGPTRTATLTPTLPLAVNTTYTLIVLGGSGGVTDVAGNPLAADVTRTFTTAADTTPPIVTGVTPLAGTTAVATTTDVTGVFNEPMTATSIGPASMLLRDPLNTAIAAGVAYDPITRTATLTPTLPLAYLTTYTATIKSGPTGVKDAAGNALAADYVWSFTTGPDTTPPTVTVVTPAAGAIAVPTASTVTATFSEAMTATTITTATVVLRDPANVVVGATVSYNPTSRQVTLTPTAALASLTTYTARVVGGASGVKDSVGNAMAADFVWPFTTIADTTPPTVTSVTPLAGATNVSTTAKPTVVFSEAMSSAAIDSTTVVLTDPLGTPVAATVAYTAANRTATVTPTSALLSTTTYTATVKSGAAGVKDAAGNPLAADYVWTFSTTSCPCTLFTAANTPGLYANDPSAVDVGMKFKTDINGQITAIRFYKQSANTGTHVGSLWTSTGTLLGRVTFVNETASGWQEATLATPVAVTANTTYIVSFHTNTGFGYTLSGFASQIDRAPLHGLSYASAGGNGVFVYATNPAFPNQPYDANFWVDVVFRP